jgi:hypothetical protein
MSDAILPIALGTRVIRADGGDFRARTVIAATPRYIVAADLARGGECAAPAADFLAVPADWSDPPPLHVSEIRALECAQSGPIPPAARAAAAVRDAGLPALARRLDAAEAWLAWVLEHLRPLAPVQFEPQLLAAQSSRAAALRHWLRAVGDSRPDTAALAAE